MNILAIINLIMILQGPSLALLKSIAIIGVKLSARTENPHDDKIWADILTAIEVMQGNPDAVSNVKAIVMAIQDTAKK